MAEKAATWKLTDARNCARGTPYTSWAPSKDAIAMLQPGNCVRLVFARYGHSDDEAETERMWVVVDSRDGDRFAGRVDSKPCQINTLSLGSHVEFHARHIIDIDFDDPVPDPLAKWFTSCIVTRSILYGGKKVSFLFRQTPDHTDSGWRLTAGEDLNVINDTENICAVALGTVLNRDDRILHLLDHAAPAAFVWSAENARFVAVEPPPSIRD